MPEIPRPNIPAHNRGPRKSVSQSVTLYIYDTLVLIAKNSYQELGYDPSYIYYQIGIKRMSPFLVSYLDIYCTWKPALIYP